jgi:hypothetical protein
LQTEHHMSRMSPASLPELEVALHVALSVGDNEAAERIGHELDALPAPSPVPILAAALWYAEQGLHVFPLSPATKIPHKGTRGCKDAVTDAETVRTWWDRWPDSNVGIATGHLVDVVDIDGATGQRSRAQSWEMFASLDVIGTVLTPRPGGMHLYVPANAAVGNGAALLPGIDYRGRGGYVVAPPSRTDQGL